MPGHFPRQSSYFGNSELGIAAVAAEGIDYQIAAGSLGPYLRPALTSFPKHDGYLAADPTKVALLRARYESRAQGRRIVGLSWRTRSADNESKSADLIGLAPILEMAPGILFVNLQYGDCRSELAKVKKDLGVDIFQDPEVNPLADMNAFFAQVAAMDLIVTTSNTTAHAAGAQNKPVWIMLPAAIGLMWYWRSSGARTVRGILQPGSFDCDQFPTRRGFMVAWRSRARCRRRAARLGIGSLMIA